MKAHPLANPEKGTGVAMICTFGDVTDVTWWRELNLPVRAVIQTDGRLRPVTWGSAGWESESVGEAQAAYDQMAGLPPQKARAKIVELLQASGDLIGDIRPITHPVKFYEKGDRPLEIVTSRQWFIKTIEYRDGLLARGRELAWYPPFMQSRYQNWVEGLTGDWCVSRQRFFGVPFPVWYPIAANGTIQYESPLLPDESRAAGRSRRPTYPKGYQRRPARSARRLHRRSRRHGHLGDIVAHAADCRRVGGRSGPVRARVPDGPAAAGARDHPDVAVLHRRARALRARFAAVEDDDDFRLGTRSRSQEDVEVEGQRRHADGRCSRSTAATACATGRPADGRAPTRRSIPAR